MRSAFKWLVGVAVVAAAIGAWQWRGGEPARESAGELAPAIAAGDPAELVVGEPVRFKSLTIFPVSSTVARDQDRLITLAEGLQSGVVVISEVGAGQAEPAGAGLDENPDVAEETVDAANIVAAGEADPFADGGQDELNSGADVNHLLVTNNSSKPLYLMPGEILVGGQQDRCVGEELIVAPHTKRMPIEVFCVEHGRWSARTEDESAQLAARLSDGQTDAGAPAQSEANQPGGTFSQTAGYLGKHGRLTVQADQDQSGVWDSVSQVISQTQATTESGAFTANYADSEVAGRLDPYVAAMQEAIAQTPRVVGVIVAVNGEIQAADTFESTPLFRKLWPKLLKSYALDATLDGDQSEGELPVCNLARAKTFLDDAMQAKAQRPATATGW